ncbi:MAG TPA: hypothetical protein VNK94_03575 [Gaiellaceae bacterium]|nr:hypothetical protein [Gaiellaceae bacterium]
MLKKLAVLATVALSAMALMSVAPAKGKPADPVAGAACIQAGVGFLKSNDLIVTAAQRGILGLSLGEIIQLHLTNPELFSGGEGSIGNWC